MSPCLDVLEDGPVALLEHPHALPRPGVFGGAHLVTSGAVGRGSVVYVGREGRPLQPVSGTWSADGFWCSTTVRAPHPVGTVEVESDGAWVVGCGTVSRLVDGRASHGVAGYPCFLQALGDSGAAGPAVRLEAPSATPILLASRVSAEGSAGFLTYAGQVVRVARADHVLPTPWAKVGDELTSIDGVEVALIGDVEALLLDLHTPSRYPGRHWVHGLRAGAVWTDTWKSVLVPVGPSVYDVPNATF